MPNPISLRVPNDLRARIERVANASGMSLAEATRSLIERGMTAQPEGGGAGGDTAEQIATLAVVQEEFRAELRALAKSVGSINETLRDLALAVQRLYQPASAPAAQKAQAPAPGSIAVAVPKPPAYASWAAGRPWHEGEDRAQRIERLRAEYKAEFGISP